MKPTPFAPDELLLARARRLSDDLPRLEMEGRAVGGAA